MFSENLCRRHCNIFTNQWSIQKGVGSKVYVLSNVARLTPLAHSLASRWQPDCPCPLPLRTSELQRSMNVEPLI